METKDLDALLVRVKAAMDEKDYELLERLVESFVYLSHLIEDKQTTIARLRKILFGPQSEKTEEVLKGRGDDGKDEEQPTAPKTGVERKSPEEGKKEKPPGHGRNGAKDYEGAEKVSVRHEERVLPASLHESASGPRYAPFRNSGMEDDPWHGARRRAAWTSSVYGRSSLSGGARPGVDAGFPRRFGRARSSWPRTGAFTASLVICG